MQVSDTDDAALAHQNVVEEAAMEPLGWDFSKEQISLHQRSDSWASHKFDVKNHRKPAIQLVDGGDVFRSVFRQVKATSVGVPTECGLRCHTSIDW